MNLILRKRKQEDLKVRWEPCATSTPLKTVFNNKKIDYDLQKQSKISAKPLQFVSKPKKKCNTASVLLKKSTESKPACSKKIKNLKSSAFFEISSSDEDSSSDNDVRPIIKLSSTKRTQSLFLNKNLENETVERSCEKKSINSYKETQKIGKCASSSALNLKLKNDMTKNEVKNTSHFGNISSSDEQSNIFDKTKPSKSSVNDSEFCLGNKNNSVNKETFPHLNNLNKTEERKCQDMLINQTSMQPVSKNNHCVLDSSENQQAISRNEVLSKAIKRKNKNMGTKIDPIKKRKTRKVNGDLATQAVPGENVITPVLLFHNKINQSHQLFSDSRVQECINSLDLTSAEINEASENKSPSMQEEKNLPVTSYTSLHPSNQEILNKSKKSKKVKKNLVKACLAKNPSERLMSDVDAKEQIKFDGSINCKNNINKLFPSEEPNVTNIFSEENNENNVKKKNVRSKKTERKDTRKVKNLLDQENKTLPDTKDMANTNNNVKINHALRSSGSNKLSTVSGREQKSLTEKSEFKLLKELLCKKKETECSVLECWSVNTFKCGVFKLKVTSQMSCKTLHCNSYLGGVLIKGNLKMKVGDKEQELTEGDMAFVPPLTKWQAVNIGECESVFYYWCGRFNSRVN